MSCLCGNDQSLYSQANTHRLAGKVKNVKTLVQLSSDSLLERVVPPNHWAQLGNKFALDYLSEEEIIFQVERFWLGEIPSTLASKMLRDAMCRHDNQHDIHKLLILYLCLIRNMRSSQLSTPLYLYGWREGRVLLLKTLVSSSTVQFCQDLSLNMYNFYHRPDVLQSWTYEIEPQLELERVRLGSSEECLVHQVLSLGSHLGVLRVHTVCTDQMLAIVSQTCLCLAWLDVSFAKNVTDLGIGILCRKGTRFTDTIQQIQLEGTSVTRKSILILLESCKSLINIESSMLEEFLLEQQERFSQQINQDSQHGYKLKQLSLCIRNHCDVRPSVGHLVPIIFPNLEEIQIHFVHPKEVDSLGFLNNLHHLHSLMIAVVDLEYLRPALTSIGKNLVTLRYVFYGGERGHINISIIQQHCSNLQSLSLSGNCIMCSNQFGQEGREVFPHLTDLHITSHSFIPYQVWYNILSLCPFLVQVELTNCQGLTDDSLTEMLDSYPGCMARLEKLSIRGGHRGDVTLTERSLVLLNTRCALLTQLGDFFTWSLSDSSPTVATLREVEDGGRGVR